MTKEELVRLLTEYKKWLESNIETCIAKQRYEIGNTYLIKEDIYCKCLKKIKELEEEL